MGLKKEKKVRNQLLFEVRFVILVKKTPKMGKNSPFF